jgi:hypothetical protein
MLVFAALTLAEQALGESNRKRKMTVRCGKNATKTVVFLYKPSKFD